MADYLREIEVSPNGLFLLLINGKDGSKIKLANSECVPVGPPRIVGDISRALEDAPENSQAYILGPRYPRTDLHGHTLQAIQFYRLSTDI